MLKTDNKPSEKGTSKMSNDMAAITKMMNDTETKTALENASQKTGVNIEGLMVMAILESTGNKSIGTNKLGYTGLMQLGEAAIKDIQKNQSDITYEGVKNDVGMNALGGAIYWKQNEKTLQNKDIISNTTHQYLAHQLGASGLKNLLETVKNNPDAPLTKGQRNNTPQQLIKEKGGIDNVTQEDFHKHWTNRIQGLENEVKKYRSEQN